MLKTISKYPRTFESFCDFIAEKGTNPAEFLTKVSTSSQYLVLTNWLLHKNYITFIRYEDSADIFFIKGEIICKDHITFISKVVLPIEHSEDVYRIIIAACFEWLEDKMSFTTDRIPKTL